MTGERAALDRTVANLTASLIERRRAPDHWDGHLSGSALSTATAIIALSLAERDTGRKYGTLIDSGVSWLIAHQNADGGWGDTVLSFSNLSTTALGWAALSMESSAPAKTAVEKAGCWMRAAIGELNADRLREAIVRRYGKDRTFSVPILTTLVLTGRLGNSEEAWRHVPQLPFELAACPHQWFQWLRLPVVSYALPALVALGQVRHHHAPTRNPVLRQIRRAATPRTLEALRSSQPESGGYLEATPLTSFVVMSMVSAGQSDHPTVGRGLRFLVDSMRDDGSWPIDTNLATWVTTLTVNAVAPHGVLSASERQAILDWLIARQFQHEHPFTHAAPGGWAWTDLSGGVPDADDTAGALLALRNLGGATARARRAAEAGVAWLLGLQNRDGGIPTFCRGWGALPFDRSAPDLTAHALQAWSAWHVALPTPLQRKIAAAAERALRYLAASQRSDGSWLPLWFGNQHTAGEENPTYGTAGVLVALATPLARRSPDAERLRRRGLDWLLRTQNADGGWGGGDGAPSSIEESGVALHACGCSLAIEPRSDILAAGWRGLRWMIAATDEGRRTPTSPIGLYFARLWYFEEMYPLVFGLAGLLEMQSTFTNPTPNSFGDRP